MTEDTNTPADQELAEAKVDKFRDRLGPFVTATEKTRMAMLFTNAEETENPIVFANDAFLELTGFSREEVLGMCFKALMTRGSGSEAAAEIEAAFAGRTDNEPEVCYRRKDGSNFWASLHISPVCDEAGEIVQNFISIIDHTKQRDKQSHCEMLIDELNHRVKNTLATVQSIVRQALRGNAEPAVIKESIESRIFALARSHDLLTHQNWEGAGLRDLIEAALKPFGVANGRAERFKIEGPDIRLLPKATLALGIAFHELATNAVKYGAFANDVGTIALNWVIEAGSAGERLLLTWREQDGPLVAAPTHKGFGSQVIERGLAHELQGSARLEYLRSGVLCTIDVPVPGKAVDV